MRKVIDFRVVPRTEKCLGAWNPKTIKRPLKRYVEMYKMHERIHPIPLEEQMAMMREVGIVKAVICAADNETTWGAKLPDETIAEIARQHPDMFIGFAGVDGHKVMTAVRGLERAVTNLGLRGVNIGPFFQQLHSNDKKYYPIYAKAVELDVPVVLHTSVNFDPGSVMDFGHPKYLDEVAVDFPDLKIVASHAGWPWVLDMVAVAWRHENVFLEISGIVPRYIHPELLKYFDNVLQNQVLFGTDYPLYDFEKGVKGFEELPLKDDTKEKILYGNAARVLGIE